MSVRLVFFLILSLKSYSQLPSGRWRAVIEINDTAGVPFNFTSDGKSIVIHNADENITVTDIDLSGDSIVIYMPVFDTQFRGKITTDSLTGIFQNRSRLKNNIFRFYATRSSFRFTDRPGKPAGDINGRYKCIFDKEQKESETAIAIFKQEGSRVTGTFLTTTGDYRFLEGELSGNMLSLSAFDGSHLFLFTGTVKGDSVINGHYFSGSHWHDTWRAKKDSAAQLDTDSLTFYTGEKFDFTFPDENGNPVSLSDTRFTGKKIVIQLMASWCSNCLDETKFLSAWYNNRKGNNTEVIAIDYERITDTSVVNRNIRRLKKQLNIKYPVLFGGSSDKAQASGTLPMLNRVFAFPTTIFLDENKNVLKIHTGFNGPATGQAYEDFRSMFLKLVE